MDEKITTDQFYIVEVEELLQKLVAIRATSEKEALAKVREKYDNCYIQLDSNDLKETNIRMFEYSDPSEIERIIQETLEDEEKEKEIIDFLDSLYDS